MIKKIRIIVQTSKDWWLVGRVGQVCGEKLSILHISIIIRHFTPPPFKLTRRAQPGGDRSPFPSGNIELRRDAMGNAISIVQL